MNHQLRTQHQGSSNHLAPPRPKMEDDDDLTTLINPQSVVDTQAGGIPWDALGSFFG